MYVCNNSPKIQTLKNYHVCHYRLPNTGKNMFPINDLMCWTFFVQILLMGKLYLVYIPWMFGE